MKWEGYGRKLSWPNLNDDLRFFVDGRRAPSVRIIGFLAEISTQDLCNTKQVYHILD
jgi:hypothetical protein